MTQTFNVLIIDDHPLIIESFKRALKHITATCSDYKFKIKTASTCDSANAEIDEFVQNGIIDLVFLDISLPVSKKGVMTSGEDIGVRLRSLFIKVKIIVATTYTNNYRLTNILKTDS